MIKRTIWAYLVGTILAVDVTEAKSCRLDRANLTAQSQAKWSSEIERPDLIGRSFRVERVSSRWLAPKVAEITVLVRSGDEAFLVRQLSDFSGVPVDNVKSIKATDKLVSAISWSARSASVERKHFYGSFDGIIEGPLVSFGLTAKDCT